MDTQSVVKLLSDLAQLDIDAIEAYDQALKNIDEPIIHTSISSFRDDHIKHVDDLAEKIIALGATPPNRSKDIKGFIIKGFTAIRSSTGTEGALKAMQTNEKLTNAKYKEAFETELPFDVKALIEKNYSDERRHLAYIEQTLEANF